MNQLVSITNGKMIPPSEIQDLAFSQEGLGKTIGFISKDGIIVSPCDGIIEEIHPCKHALSIRMEDGISVLIHVGIETYMMKGKGFTRFIKKGMKVQAGQKLLEIDLYRLIKHNLDTTIMLVLEEVFNPVSWIEYGDVQAGQRISQ